MEPRGQLEVRAFSDDVIDDAAPLLAHRHRQQRAAEPGLSPVYEDVAAARSEIATLATKEGASGAVAVRGGQVVGYLVGAPRAPSWGPNIWVEGSGHAVAEPEVVRDLYGFAAARWVDEGATSHYAVVPATDGPLVDAWFRVIGSAVGCAIEESSQHHGIVRPSDAGFLGFAAVLPEARGLGAGRALGEAVLLWARDAGHSTVVTDWRETNLLSSRAWPSLGFRPTFRRLFRAIA